MAYKPLLLPKDKKAQLQKLLEKLNSWDRTKFELILTALTQKNQAVRSRSTKKNGERLLSLKLLSAEERKSLIASFSHDEQTLYEELEKWKPHA